MSQIKSRKDFEHNINLLSEKMRLGIVKFSIESKKSVKGLLNARMAPNNRVNFHTINEMARLTANTVANMDERKNKNIEE
ncbi:AVAST type 1 anti-phage system protein Avs1c [Flavobacterium hiemivividum]|jgi:hypothetical protein|nr:AVAST type 1 anti-phage system protein Avs1c [Flavobacterium hiemivividum]